MLRLSTAVGADRWRRATVGREARVSWNLRPLLGASGDTARPGFEHHDLGRFGRLFKRRQTGFGRQRRPAVDTFGPPCRRRQKTVCAVHLLNRGGFLFHCFYPHVKKSGSFLAIRRASGELPNRRALDPELRCSAGALPLAINLRLNLRSKY
jgi:hypothetical protein